MSSTEALRAEIAAILNRAENCRSWMARSQSISDLLALLQKVEREARIATVQTILNTCKYESRELYLSTTAVESLLKDLKNNDDSHKAITAIDKATLQGGDV